MHSMRKMPGMCERGAKRYPNVIDHEHCYHRQSRGNDAQSPSVCSFTVHFSCLEPASKWSVGFDVSRGYPFGRVNIVPETEFGSAPSDVADICDVAFGYTRLERACEYLNDLFLKSCQGRK